MDAWELLASNSGRQATTIPGLPHSHRFRRVTLNPLGEISKLASAVLRDRLGRSLRRFNPDVVFLPGWSCRGAIFAMHWCVHNRKRVVVMSESTFLDAKRRPLDELVKRRFLRLVAASLAGGTRQKDYLINLGMEPERVALGYDAVDNCHFETGAANVRSAENEECEGFQAGFRRSESRPTARPLLPCFGAVHRKEEPSKAHRGLCSLQKLGTKQRGDFAERYLGSGSARRWALHSALSLQLSALGLLDAFTFPVFNNTTFCRPFTDWPKPCSASTTEQWGLVINEAMASGLPVIVSNRCGCVSDLVREGYNGFVFDPNDVERLARLMLRVSAMEKRRDVAWGASRRSLLTGDGVIRRGLREAIASAMSAAPFRASFWTSCY